MRSDRGEISLVGLLVATVIFGIVLGATLTSFDVFNRNARDSQVRNEATDAARTATDTMAREMRNLATPTAMQPNAVTLASPYDIVFETVAKTGTPPASNPQNVEFARYCLDSATGRFWTMRIPASAVTSSTVAPSTAGACPGGSPWSNARVVAASVVNRYNGANRPVFTFDSTQNNAIRRIGVDLFVDPDPGKGPAEQRVSTGVDLRNQDRGPTAQFAGSTPGRGIIVLDGTASTDPDDDPLDYCWYDTAATSTAGTCGAHSIGDTSGFQYTVTPGTSHTITLTVTDPSGLPSTSAAQTFTNVP